MEYLTVTEKIIVVVKDFHERPYGRYNDDCPNCHLTSGQAFRQKVLTPALRANDKVVVDLTGRNRYGRSFLDEAFGGLIRNEGFTGTELKQKLRYRHDELESVILVIDDRINKAEEDRLASS